MAFTNTSFTDNITDEEEAYASVSCIVSNKDWTFTVIPPYVLVISVLGILLNAFVLTVFCLHKKPCTIPEIYLSNLAAADLLLVSCLPFWAIYIYNRFNWTFGLSMCKIVNVSLMMNMYCSIYFLVLISTDRYLALVHPLSHKRISEPVHARFACLLVWILGVLLSVPTLIYRTTITVAHSKTYCSLKYPSTTVNLTSESITSLLGFVVPVSIISLCTFQIIKSLRNRLVEETRTTTDHKATSLVLAVLWAFLICWVPLHVIRIPAVLYDVKILTECSFLYIVHICRQVFLYFAFFNSVLNPILYVIIGKTFRKKAKAVFIRLKQRRTPTFTFTSTSTKLTRSIKSQDTAVSFASALQSPGKISTDLIVSR